MKIVITIAILASAMLIEFPCTALALTKEQYHEYLNARAMCEGSDTSISPELKIKYCDLALQLATLDSNIAATNARNAQTVSESQLIRSLLGNK